MKLDAGEPNSALLASCVLQRSVSVNSTGHHDRDRAPTVGTRLPLLDGVFDALGDSLPGSLGEVADGFKALGECMYKYGPMGCGLVSNV